MLDHVPHRDRVKRGPGQRRREQVGGEDLEPEPIASIGRAKFTRFDPYGPPAAVARLGQQEPHPASQVSQRSAVGQVRLDSLQRAASGLALSGFLVYVIDRRGTRVGVGQNRPLGHRVGLHVAAAQAASDVTQRDAEAAGARDQPPWTHGAGHGHVRLALRAPQAAHQAGSVLRSGLRKLRDIRGRPRARR